MSERLHLNILSQGRFSSEEGLKHFFATGMRRLAFEPLAWTIGLSR